MILCFPYILKFNYMMTLYMERIPEVPDIKIHMSESKGMYCKLYKKTPMINKSYQDPTENVQIPNWE